MSVEFDIDGRTTCGVDVDRWDFNWQFNYFYEQAITMSPTDQVKVTCGWNTSNDTEPVYPRPLRRAILARNAANAAQRGLLGTSAPLVCLPRMPSRAIWLSITTLLACTRADVRPEPEAAHVEPASAPIATPPIERKHACTQHYPRATPATWDEPWIWSDDDTYAEPCQWGCTTVRGTDPTRYEGVSVVLRDDGRLRITGEDGHAGAWSRRAPAGSFVAAEARWLGGWCSRRPDESERIFVAMANAHTMRVLAIERDSGALVADRDIRLAAGQASSQGPIELRLYCDPTGGPQVHTKQGDTGWTVRLDPNLDVLSLRELPAGFTSWEWKPLIDRRGVQRGIFLVTDRTEPPPPGPRAREEIMTNDRRYVRSEYELRAFDLAGNLLWQRTIDKATPGCIESGMRGCSGCPAEEAGLGMRDDFVVLWTTGVTSTIDVFDASGRRVAYIHY